MKRLVTAVALGSIMTLPLTAFAQDKVDLDSDQAKLSYSIGATLGQGLSKDIKDLDVDAFAAAIKDVYGDADLQMSQDEISSTLTQYQQQKIAEQKAEIEAQMAGWGPTGVPRCSAAPPVPARSPHRY